jgi:hypothetical protein
LQNADWFLWRLLSSKFLSVSLQEVEEFWSIEDVADAHEVLDAIEAAEARAYSKK